MNISFDISQISSSEAHALILMLNSVCFPEKLAPNPETVSTSDPVPTSEAPDTEIPNEAQEQAPRRRGRPKAGTEGVVKAVEEVQVQPTLADTVKVLTVDDLRAALNGFISRHSMEEAIEVLKSFGCNRVSEAATLEPAKLAGLAEKLNG